MHSHLKTLDLELTPSARINIKEADNAYEVLGKALGGRAK